MKRTINIDDLFPVQYKIFNEIINTPASKTKHFCLVASRQSGKTFLIIRLAIYLAFFKPNQSGGFVSASDRQFKKVFRKFLETIPAELITGTKEGNSITFVNGSTLEFFTAASYEFIRGNTFDFLIGDEMSIWPDAAFDVVTPTLSAKKEARGIFCSTPGGKNSFYYLYLDGKDPNDTFVKSFKMHYSDNPEYDRRDVDHKKKTMSPYAFRAEYENEFIFGAGQVFGEYKQVQVDHWEPYRDSDTYYAGIDWSAAGKDDTVLFIVNQEGKTASIYVCTEKNTIKQIRELLPILNKWKPLIYSEMNGVGTGPTDYLELEEAKEGTFRLKKITLTNELKGELVTGFNQDKDLEGTKMALPNPDLCSELDHQMAMYEMQRTLKTGKITYSHPKSGDIHDDYVDAMLYAYRALRDENPARQFDILGHIEDDSIDEKIKQTFRLAEDMRDRASMSKEVTELIDNIW
jgi:hypothetical protein